MRDIKFRAWDGEEMIQQENTLISINGNIYFAECQSELWGDYTLQNVENYELMQFTEFSDKHNHDIYDRDIVEERYFNHLNGNEEVLRYIVQKENGMWKLRNHKGRQEYDRYLFMRNKRVEVVGNIYENKELLEVEK